MNIRLYLGKVQVYVGQKYYHDAGASLVEWLANSIDVKHLEIKPAGLQWQQQSFHLAPERQAILC